MKFFLAIACLLLVTDVIHGLEQKSMVIILHEHITPCAAELNISPEEIMAKFESTELSDEDKAKFGCLKACVMRHMGIMEGTEFKVEKFQETVEKLIEEPEKATKALENMKACVEEAKGKTDACELAYEVAQCMKQKETE